MPRASRPSDLYRLPAATPSREPPPSKRSAPDEGPAPRTKRLRWAVLGAGALVVALGMQGVVDGPDGPPPPAPSVRAVEAVRPVDLEASTEEALAALAVHEAGRRATTDLRRLAARFEPDDALRARDVAFQAHERLAAAIFAAQRIEDPDPLATAVWADPRQQRLLEDLVEITGYAARFTAIERAHQAVLSPEAGDAEALLAAVPAEPDNARLETWITTLRVAGADVTTTASDPGSAESTFAFHDGRDASGYPLTQPESPGIQTPPPLTPEQARRAASADFATSAAVLRSVPPDRLQRFLDTLPATTLAELDRHPTAGPVLDELR